MHADTTLRNSMSGTDSSSDGQLTYKVPHAARLLDLGVRTVWGLVHSGEIESFKIGASRLIPRTALEAYIAKKCREEIGDQRSVA